MVDVPNLARIAGCEPAVVDWLDAVAEIAGDLPELQSPDPARRRRAAHQLSDALATRFTLPGDARCEVSEYRVPTRAGEITVLRYQPPGEGPPRLAHLSLHGGGFVLGSVREVINDRLLRHRAAASGVAIFAAEYRLAPEHPFPAGLEDCLDALHWLIDAAPGLGIRADRIGIGGISAGGNLAGLVAAHARDSGLRLDHQVLEVPGASLHIDQDASYHQSSALSDFGDLSDTRSAYLNGADPGGRWTAPADITDLAGLPPALVLTAEFDPLRDSGERYAARLSAAGVPVLAWRAPGHLHGSLSITRTSATARAWQSRVVDFLRSRAHLPLSPLT
ncbi:alpha/beta hydrolase fold domain-containing protein [Streptomyces sp. NPDC046925]|uniref:alpha/beta hydrolase fold domain-containing protein n=1 Tax=Streptomyces sp. NPDC046925 TaxID=3155375 RepID=UPI0033D50DB2